MKTLLLLFLFCHVSSAVKHSLKYFLTASSSGDSDFRLVGITTVDDVQMTYCDSNNRRLEPRQDWARRLFTDDPRHLAVYAGECFENQPFLFRATMENLKQRFNQSEGVHVFQSLRGFEWDDETGEVNGFNQFSYDGEDFLAFDLKTSTWVAPKPQAVYTKLRWDADQARIIHSKLYLTQILPDWLKRYLAYGSNSLLRTELPSVSLLQKTPSSPVSCHATGFYPDRAVMFWRKDGELLHRDVDHGETLPNHDGSFQMSVDLKPPSDPAEDWKKYECVFQLSGVDVVTSLDKAKIRTNWEEPADVSVPVAAAVAAAVGALALALVLIAAVRCMISRKKKAPENDFALTAETGPESKDLVNKRAERAAAHGMKSKVNTATPQYVALQS